MIPYPSNSLGLIASRIGLQLIADLKSEYVMADAGVMAMLLGSMQGEMAEGIERRMTDISAMKSLFTEALKHLDDPLLKQKLEAILPVEVLSLRMEDVNQLHDDCSRLLIDLQTNIEESNTGALVELNEGIWRYLADHADRHALQVQI